MRNTILISISSFILFCCNTQQEENSITIFNNISFLVLKNEKILGTDHLLASEYFNLIENQDIQIPLYKSLNTDKYTIHIGIPYQAKLSNLNKIRLDNNLTEIISDSSTFTYKKYTIKQKNIIEYAYKKNTNLLYLLAITHSDSIANSVLLPESLSHRIKIDKNED